ncbi:TPA: hypothetical protein ACQM90_001324, partial [Streptococcus pyogenes]
ISPVLLIISKLLLELFYKLVGNVLSPIDSATREISLLFIRVKTSDDVKSIFSILVLINI